MWERSKESNGEREPAKAVGYCCCILLTAFQWCPIEGGSCVLLSLLERHGGRGRLGSAISQQFETDEVDNERY